VIPLAALEEVIDASGAAPRIEALLTAGVRARQLSVRTLLAGMCLALADGRPAHLTRVHRALAGLPEGEQRRLGVLADWKGGPHRLTYRQAEYTFGLVARALGKDDPDGLPSGGLQAACDSLLEASVPRQFKGASTSLAVDWSDLESFSRPPPARGGDCADPEASWGHRKNNLLHDEDELFFGYYLSAAVMAADEKGPALPELARRVTVSSCRHDPVPAFTPVLTAMPRHGIPLGDILADSGYSHRIPQNWASPLCAAGAALVQDLHPQDRGPKGTHAGAVIANGNLYCPATPRTLLGLGPLAPGAAKGQAAAHDARTAEAAHYKLDRLTADDEDGYHRVTCPAAAGKIRCPLRPASMTWTGTARRSCSPRTTPRPAARSRPSPSRRTSARNPAETRLPVGGLAALLPPAHRRRARVRHRQGPRQQRHQPRLVPPHGPDTPDALRHHAARRPQPAHPGGLEHPAGRKPAPRRQGPAAQNPQTPPQDTRRGHRRTALTADPARAIVTTAQYQPARTGHTAPRNSKKGASGALPADQPGQDHRPARNVRPKRETTPHRNVKTSAVELRGLEPLTLCLQSTFMLSGIVAGLGLSLFPVWASRLLSGLVVVSDRGQPRPALGRYDQSERSVWCCPVRRADTSALVANVRQSAVDRGCPWVIAASGRAWPEFTHWPDRRTRWRSAATNPLDAAAFLRVQSQRRPKVRQAQLTQQRSLCLLLLAPHG